MPAVLTSVRKRGGIIGMAIAMKNESNRRKIM
jgi:hypothetical protein